MRGYRTAGSKVGSECPCSAETPSKSHSWSVQLRTAPAHRGDSGFLVEVHFANQAVLGDPFILTNTCVSRHIVSDHLVHDAPGGDSIRIGVVLRFAHALMARPPLHKLQKSPSVFHPPFA